MKKERRRYARKLICELKGHPVGTLEDLKDILDKINFNFGEFDQLMSDVAEAKIELVEAGKIASDAKYEWSEFESYCKSSGEIQTILAASEKSGNA